MRPSEIVKTLRGTKGKIFVETLLTSGGDPVEVEAVKADIIFMYRDMPDDAETGMMVVHLNHGMVLVRDHEKD